MSHSPALLTAAFVLTLLAGCSPRTQATDKAKAMAAKVTIVKAELVYGDPAEYSGHRHQQLKLTIKNDNAEPLDSLMGHLVIVDQNGRELDLTDEVMFAADPHMGTSPVPGFATKEGVMGEAFTAMNEIVGTTNINVFQIKAIEPKLGFKNEDHFMAYIGEKPK